MKTKTDEEIVMREFQSFWHKWDGYFFNPLSPRTKKLLESLGVKNPEKLINALAKRPEKSYRQMKKEFFSLCEKKVEKAREKETFILNSMGAPKIIGAFFGGQVTAFLLVQGRGRENNAIWRNHSITTRPVSCSESGFSPPTKKHVLGTPWTTEELQENPFRCLTSDMVSNRSDKKKVTINCLFCGEHFSSSNLKRLYAFIRTHNAKITINNGRKIFRTEPDMKIALYRAMFLKEAKKA